MNKRLQLLGSKRPIIDFTNKLTTKWNLLTTSTALSPPHEADAQKNMKAILAQLISFPTATGNWQANHDALDYIDNFLSSRGMLVRRLEWNNVETLFATTRKTKTPRILLAAHLDVVPGEEKLFELQEEDGKLYGRGTLDMKFAIAGYLQLIEDLGPKLRDYDFGIMINTDEEVGGYDGAARMAEEGYVPEVFVNPDGGRNWAIEESAKGMWWVTLNATGKSAHASQPWEGDSAINKLLDAIQEIRNLFPRQSPDDSTLNVGTIRAGDTPNQIASSATATLDVRLASHKDDAALHSVFQAICDTYGIELVTEVYSPPIAHDPKNPYVKAFADVIERHIGRPAGFIKSNALNDARFFMPKGVACVLFYPPGGGHHSQTEWIATDAFYRFRDILRSYIEEQGQQHHTPGSP